mmetsp:Transcript_6535/g.14439  ORF Transcript_6535/g.14439 Transcript_6535/m.14439 type:complete len:425 (-) Transcript_6535:77-1351(-)
MAANNTAASSMWDNVVASATKAATQAGEATQVAANRAKLHADLLVIDRDMHARKEKFGVEMYAHLEAITSTQEFYVADDRLINVLRPTLIKAQREVAAYERKRDAMKGKVNMAEANRSGTASIFSAATIGEKIMNAAKYAAAGAKEAATKTELAMLERQILGFKEEFGVELYPIFESMEDNEGWLPTDRKVRSLYDSCREDIAKMQKSKEEKREQIKQLGGVEGSGLTPPVVTPTVVATPVAPAVASSVGGGYTPSSSAPAPASGNGAMPWASTEPKVSNGYGSSQSPPVVQPTSLGSVEQPKQLPPIQLQPTSDSGFGFMQSQQTDSQYSNNPAQPQQMQQQKPTQPQQSLGAAFDPFEGITSSNANAMSSTGTTETFNIAMPATQQPPQQQRSSANAFDPFSSGSNGNNQALSDADMNLFKY